MGTLKLILKNYEHKLLTVAIFLRNVSKRLSENPMPTLNVTTIKLFNVIGHKIGLP